MPSRSVCKVFIVTLVCCLAQNCLAAPSSTWSAVVDRAHEVTWFTPRALQDAVNRGQEASGQSLREYAQETLMTVTDYGGHRLTFDADDLKFGSDSGSILRLAVAHLLLYLIERDSKDLQNAETALRRYEGRFPSRKSLFWRNVIEAHKSIASNDSAKFQRAIFSIWADVILDLECRKIRNRFLNAHSDSLVSYYAENLVNLVLSEAIDKGRLPDLQPLTAVVLCVQGHLIDSEAGSGSSADVATLIERMEGAFSDNGNLNVAEALEHVGRLRAAMATPNSESAAWQVFEESRSVLVDAMSWARTTKGRAVVLMQYLDLLNSVIFRMSEHEAYIVGERFSSVPSIAEDVTDQSLSVFAILAGMELDEEKIESAGFRDVREYYKVTRLLYRSTATFFTSVARYYYKSSEVIDASVVNTIVPFVVRHLEFFDKYSVEHEGTVSNDAYWLAWEAKKQLASVYRTAARGVSSAIYLEEAFSTQASAILANPLDIDGVLALSSLVSQVDGMGVSSATYEGMALQLAGHLVHCSSIKEWMEEYPDDQLREEFDVLVSAIPVLLRYGDGLQEFIGRVDLDRNSRRRVAVLVALVYSELRDMRNDIPSKDKLDAISVVASRAPSPGEVIQAIRAVAPVVAANIRNVGVIDGNFPLGGYRRFLRTQDSRYHELFRRIFKEMAEYWEGRSAATER